MLKVEVNVAGVRHEFAQHVCKVQGAFNSAAGIVPGTSRVIEHFADGLVFILHFAGKPNCDDPFRHVSLNAQLPGRVAVVGPEAWHPIRSDLARSYRGQRCSSWLLVGRGLCGPDECLRPSASLSAISASPACVSTTSPTVSRTVRTDRLASLSAIRGSLTVGPVQRGRHPCEVRGWG
jgi:hypothetical protein